MAEAEVGRKKSQAMGEAANSRKKKRRTKDKEDTGGGGCLDEVRVSDGGRGGTKDPLVILGSDMLTKMFEYLDARSVARSVLVSRGWQQVASSDLIWKPKCEDLWNGKAHIPRSSLMRGASKLEAFSLSMMDGARSRIMKEDLCDHTWEFCFKQTAPAYWLNLDPSREGTGSPMRRYFHPNGSQTADPTDKVWGGHECKYSVITSFVEGGRIRENYVRINKWPHMSVTRKQDWSWEMVNNMCSYSSIPDAEKGEGTGPLFPFW